MKKILVVGDLYVRVAAFQNAFSPLLSDNSIRFIQMNEADSSQPRYRF